MSRPLWRFAMMRLFRSIGSVPGFAMKGGLCVFVLAASPPRHASAQVESDPGGTLPLPLPVEEIESPERLDEVPRAGAGCSGRVSVRDGSLVSSGVAGRAELGGWDAGATVWYGAPGSDRTAVRAATGEIDAARGRLRAVLGRVSVRGIGVLLGERLEVSSRAARLASVRASAPEIG